MKCFVVGLSSYFDVHHTLLLFTGPRGCSCLGIMRLSVESEDFNKLESVSYLSYQHTLHRELDFAKSISQLKHAVSPVSHSTTEPLYICELRIFPCFRRNLPFTLKSPPVPPCPPNFPYARPKPYHILPNLLHAPELPLCPKPALCPRTSPCAPNPLNGRPQHNLPNVNGTSVTCRRQTVQPSGAFFVRSADAFVLAFS